MKQFSTLCTCLCLMLLSCALWAAPVTYPGPAIQDDTGAKVTPTSISVASVTDLDGNAIAAPGAVAHFAGSNSSVVYDPATKGEAWITLTPVLAGHTFATNPPIIFCSVDAQTLAGNNTLLVAVKPQTDKIGTTGADSTNVTGIKTKTDLIATNSADSPNAVTQQGQATAIKAKTDLIATNSGDSTNAIAQQAQTTAIKLQTDKLLFDGSNNLRSIIYGYNTGQDPATLVLDSTASSHNTAGTTGAKINATGSAGDPWATLAPGSYASGTFGYLVSHPTALSDIFNTPRTGVTYAGTTWGNFLNTQLANPVPADYQQRGVAVTLPSGTGNYYAPVTFSNSTTSTTNLTLTVVANGLGQPVLTWSVDTTAISYKVLRSTDGITYTVIATGLTVTTYTDATAPTGTVRYTVIANH